MFTPTCRCGSPVGPDDVIRTTTGKYYICGACWELGRRRWFRPASKAEKNARIAAVERVEAAA